MRSSKLIRTTAVVVGAALVFGAFVAAPAEAKKKKKHKKPAACAPYVPGEAGADQPITVVTDAATADAPVEVKLSTDPGLGFSSSDGPSGDEGATSHAYTNVQIDSAAASRGLYVRVEFAPTWDYDLFLRSSDGTAIAYAAGYNVAPVSDPLGVGLDGTGHGGHSEQGAEVLDGVDSPDCTGYTIDVSSASTPGGDVTVKYWLGDPAPAE